MESNTARLRAFLVLADELNFTRAARRLHVSQQGLSSTMARLERDLGVRLFERTTRAVSLTPSGAAFLPLVRRTLQALDEAVAVARRIERTGRGVLRVGAMVAAALELTDPILEAFALRQPDVDVELSHYLFDDPSAGLRDGATDIAFVRLPVNRTGLAITDLLHEPVWVVTRADHPFAGEASVTLDHLTKEAVVRPLSPDEAWNDFWSGGGRFRVEIGARSLEEAFELTAAGRAVSLAAAGWVRFAMRRGLRGVPVEGLPGSVLAVATRRGRPDPITADFYGAAVEVLAARRDLVEQIEHP